MASLVGVVGSLLIARWFRRQTSGLDPVGVFTYFLGTSATGVSTVATADLPSITAVEVRLSVDGDGPGGAKPTVLRSTVRPFNL